MSKKLVFSQEQEAVLETLNGDEQDILIIARAGAGKTTILTELAFRWKKEKVIYLSFNNLIAKESKSKFPNNTVIQTVHAYAYQRYKKNYQHKIKNKINVFDILEKSSIFSPLWRLHPNNQEIFDHAYYTLQIITKFQNSDEKKISSNLIDNKLINELFEKGYYSKLTQLTIWAEELWSEMTDTLNNFPIEHDTYLKLFQLEEKGFEDCNLLLIDEFQDTNPCVIDICQKTKAKKYYVGDDKQTIYQFKGIEDPINQIKCDVRLHLTQSYRFGPKIAQAANTVISNNNPKKHFKRVKGNETISSVIRGYPDYRCYKLGSDKVAMIFRTNAVMIATAFTLYSKGIMPKININKESFNAIIDICNLYNNFSYSPKSELLKRAKTLENLIKLKKFDISVSTLLKIANSLKERLEDFQDFYKKITMIQERNEEYDLFLTTAHKSKGTEFDIVILGGDFPVNPKGEARDEEFNLLYVAITRAKKEIYLGECVAFTSMIKP